MSKVPNTPENAEICKQFCGPCPTFKPNELPKHPPHMLFCSRGASEKPKGQIEDKGCFCPGCGVFKNYELEGGWFCTYGPEGKK
ncbi:MAG: DUF2769 domain-containing protein [Candidatus Thorarchaeota archaeon]